MVQAAVCKAGALELAQSLCQAITYLRRRSWTRAKHMDHTMPCCVGAWTMLHLPWCHGALARTKVGTIVCWCHLESLEAG